MFNTADLTLTFRNDPFSMLDVIDDQRVTESIRTCFKSSVMAIDIKLGDKSRWLKL